MNLINKILIEGLSKDIFYHATSDEKAGISILEKGEIKVPDQKERPNTLMKPINGKIYATKNLQYAIIYVLGGDMAGHKLPDRWIQESRYGYLFKLEELDEDNILPDEDDIGEMIYSKTIPALNFFAQGNLTKNQYEKVMQGEYAWWSASGKKILKILPKSNPSLLRTILQYNKSIAHEGDAKIIAAWRFDKTKSELLNKDGSNFFELAEKIK